MINLKDRTIQFQKPNPEGIYVTSVIFDPLFASLLIFYISIINLPFWKIFFYENVFSV